MLVWSGMVVGLSGPLVMWMAIVGAGLVFGPGKTTTGVEAPSHTDPTAPHPDRW